MCRIYFILLIIEKKKNFSDSVICKIKFKLLKKKNCDKNINYT